MTIFSCSELTKSFPDKILFDNISFGMESGERIGIIGRNGTGKTTLMKIVAGLEDADSGEVFFNSKVRCEYLDQNPFFETYDIALDYVMKGNKEIFDYLEVFKKLSKNLNSKNSEEFEIASQYLDLHNGWSLEIEAQKMLSILGFEDYTVPVNQLSGGMRKRVALARVLISNPELLILDEPTNHLDADSVQWLQDRLMGYNNSLLFVTHDRYFLDSISTKIFELERKKIFIYNGNYEQYLEQKESFAVSQDATIDHLRSKLRMELAWLQKGAKARRTKAKSRIDWIKILADSTQKVKEKDIKIELGKTFIGSRIIDAHNISKSVGDKKLFENFTYIATPGDRIGIIGPNGCGKSTLLNILSGNETSDTGTIKIGTSIKLGYYRQDTEELKDNQTVIGSLREIAEYIDVGTGRDRYLTTRDLLNKFLFPPNMHGAFIETLSGGEKKRLALVRLLMANPNVLLLDEPTNDFDLQTLNALEDYLDDFYGTLLIVSHDRAFLDRIVTKIFSFDGNGVIKEYPGNYSDYLNKKESLQRQKESDLSEISKKKAINNPNKQTKKKLSFNEQREYDNLEAEISNLESEKEKIVDLLNTNDGTDYKLLNDLSNQLNEIDDKINSLTNRWIELSELIESFEQN